MSIPHQFGRIADNARNGAPVVRSARIKAIAAQRLALQAATTTVPNTEETPSSPEQSEGNTPAPGSDSVTRKRSRESSPSGVESIADSEEGDESTEAPRPHKKSKSQEDQAEESVDIQSPAEIRSVANEGQIETRPQSNQAGEIVEIQSTTAKRISVNKGKVEGSQQPDLIEEVADFQSLIEPRSAASEGQIEPRPQSVQAEEVAGPTVLRNMANEIQTEPKHQPDEAEEVTGSQDPTETRSVRNGGQVEPKPQAGQPKEDAGMNGPTETSSVMKEGRVDNGASLPEQDKSFYHAIVTVVLWLRVLDQQRAAQKECLAKKDILHTLMDRKQPFVANVPTETDYQNVREKYQRDYERYERNLEARSAQAEIAGRDIPHLLRSSKAQMDRFDDFITTSTTLPDVACLKDSAEFRAVFERCRSYLRDLQELEDDISDAEHESNLAHDRIDAYASLLAARGLEAAGLIATGEPTVPAAESGDVEYSPAQEFQENISTRLARIQELRAEFQKTEQAYFEHKENLARIAEKLLIEAGMLQPRKTTPAPENAEPAPQDPENPEAVGVDDGNHSDAAEGRPSEDKEENVFAKRQAQHDALIAELMSAQFHLCDAEKAFNDSRKFTEEELAKLPRDITEDEFGRELARKLTRTTRNYIDAQKRVKDGQAEGRRLRVPEVDRYPIDQTWNFEDRSDDGYLDSTFAAKVERSKPRVEAWLPQLTTSGEPLSPSTKPQVPKKDPDFVVELAELCLGDDNGEDSSSAGAKERIARYQKACEDRRDSGLFPLAVPDRFISKQRLSELDSHMV